MKSRLFLDMHIIQTLPPSNINRDDTGSPKSKLTVLEGRYEELFQGKWRSG